MKSILPARNLKEVYGFSPLHEAVLDLHNRRLEDVAGALTTTVVDAIDYDGRTPLSWASSRGDSQAVGKLLALGADCNRADEQNNTPLIYASSVSKECVDLLL